MHRQFHYSKHFFWFGDEALTAEALAHYIRTERLDVAHHNAAWAQQTGKGLLFFTKRAEDKSHPTGVIALVSRDPRHHRVRDR